MKNGLIKCKCQHTIRHHTTDAFKVNEIVFLKSNPECPMKVKEITETEVITEWNDIYGELQTASFFPECILQYEYAGLIDYDDKFKISNN